MGVAVGERVGLAVGALVGASVGARVGACVGACVGAAVVGLFVGLKVGAAVGARVGDTEGTDVGCEVGGAVPQFSHVAGQTAITSAKPQSPLNRSLQMGSSGTPKHAGGQLSHMARHVCRTWKHRIIRYPVLYVRDDV